MILLGLLAALSLLACALPWPLKLPAAVLALARGLVLARRESGRPAFTLEWPGGNAPARLQGTHGAQTIAHPRLVLRGPIAVLSGRDAAGRSLRLAWWPDTLPSSSRRQLRLIAAAGNRPDKPLPSVAA